MDGQAFVALSLLEAVAKVKNTLAGMDWEDDRTYRQLPNGRKVPSSQYPDVYTRLDIRPIQGLPQQGERVTYQGQITVSRSLTLRHLKACYGSEEVTDISWELRLLWGKQGFLIESSIIAYWDQRHSSEMDLHLFPDRFTQTLDECLHHLAEASQDLAASTDMLYEVLPRVS